MSRSNRLFYLAGNSVLLFIFCSFISVQIAQADGLRYGVGGSTSAGDNSTFPEFILGPVSGQDPNAPVLTGAYGPITSSFDNGVSTASATTQAFVTVSHGHIGVSGSALAVESGDVTARADFQSQGTFTDLLTITHPTLAVGSPVEPRFTLSVDYEGNGRVNAFLVATEVNNRDNELNLSFDNGMPEFNFPNQSGVFSTTVGSDVYLNGLLFAQGRAIVGSPGNNSAYFYINALNSANFYIRPVTPGVSFTSASGATYAAAPVPEPTTMILLGSGLAGIAISIRRKSKRNNQSD